MDPTPLEPSIEPQNNKRRKKQLRKKRTQPLLPKNKIVKTRRLSDVQGDPIGCSDYIILAVMGFMFLPIGVMVAWLHDVGVVLFDAVVYVEKEKSWRFYATPFFTAAIGALVAIGLLLVINERYTIIILSLFSGCGWGCAWYFLKELTAENALMVAALQGLSFGVFFMTVPLYMWHQVKTRAKRIIGPIIIIGFTLGVFGQAMMSDWYVTRSWIGLYDGIDRPVEFGEQIGLICSLIPIFVGIFGAKKKNDDSSELFNRTNIAKIAYVVLIEITEQVSGVIVLLPFLKTLMQPTYRELTDSTLEITKKMTMTKVMSCCIGGAILSLILFILVPFSNYRNVWLPAILVRISGLFGFGLFLDMKDTWEPIGLTITASIWFFAYGFGGGVHWQSIYWIFKRSTHKFIAMISTLCSMIAIAVLVCLIVRWHYLLESVHIIIYWMAGTSLVLTVVTAVLWQNEKAVEKIAYVLYTRESA